MLLEDISPLHVKFTIDDLNFKAEDFDHDVITFAVRDSGGLQVGEFQAQFDDDGHVEFSNSEKYPNTLERLRKAGYSNAVARNVQKTITNILN